MRMFYLSNERFPSRDAVTIQQIQMVSSFANASLEVTLIKPHYFEMAKYSIQDICDFYGVPKNFKIVNLPSLLSISKPIYGVDYGFNRNDKDNRKVPYIGGASVLFSTWFFILLRLLKQEFNHRTIIYSRNLNATAVILHLRERWFRRKPVYIFFEAHALQQAPMQFFPTVLQKSHGIVSITDSLKRDLVRTYHLAPEKIFVAPDGVRDQWISATNGKDVRGILRQLLPGSYRYVVLYSGGFSPGKGVEIFVKTASLFDESVLFLALGGAPKTIREVQQLTGSKALKNVHFMGFVPPRDVHMFQCAADVLVLPNTQEYDLKDYTSPLKLFEYMAARRPIVASDLPVFREIIQDGENALMVQPNEPIALAAAIRRLLQDSALSKRISQTAFDQVSDLTWEKRAKRILGFIEKQVNQHYAH